MACRPYFVVDRGAWYVKWKAAPGVWKAQKLCGHPGWTKGQRPPKRPPAEAVRLARVWEEREARARQGLEADPAHATPLRTFLDDYLLTAEAGQTEGSLKILRRVATIFIDWCATKGVRTLPEVTPAVCRAYLAHRARAPGRAGDGRSGKTLAYKTLHTERGTLAPAWTQAFQDGRIAVNPWLRAPVPGKPREERPPFWTEVEVASLAAKSRPWLADLIRVGAYSGLRITSLLTLEWKDVDFEAGTIHVRAAASKTGLAYTAPMLGPARDILERRRFVSGGTLVFPGPKLGKAVPSTRTYAAIKRAVRRAGVRDFGRYNHALRHSFATWAVNRGVPLKIVAQWLGHTTTQQTERYSHADPSETARWAGYFEGKIGGGTGEVGSPPAPP